MPRFAGPIVFSLAACLAAAAVSARGGEESTGPTTLWAEAFDKERTFNDPALAVVDMPDGKKALRVRGDDPAKQYQFKQWLPIERLRGRKITVAARIRGEGVSKPQSHIHGVNFMVMMTTADGKTRWPGAKPGDGDFDWTEKRFTVDVPADAKGALLVLGLQNVGGTVYFRDVRIVAEPTAADVAKARAEAERRAEPDGPRLSLSPAGKPFPTRRGVLGHNETKDDWHGSDRSPAFFWDAVAREPRPGLVGLTHAFPLHLLRYHHGNAMNWRETVGPAAERPPQRDHWGHPQNAYPGLSEFLEWSEGLPGPPRVSLIASPFRPVDELADWVAYCNATQGPMAELRARHGRSRPYGVKIWELGNEADWEKRADLDVMRADTDREKSDRMLVGEYIERCRERIAAMRRVDPTIRFFAHAKTAPWSVSTPDWPEWHRAVLKALAADLDGIVVHPYYDGYPVKSVYDGTVDVIIRDLRAYSTAERPLTLWISEHARWVTPDRRDTWSNSWNLDGAVSTGHFLMEALRRPEIEFANYWCYGHKGPWRVLTREKGADGAEAVSPTAIFHLFRLLNRAVLDEVQPLAVTGAGEETVLALSFRSGVRRSVLLCNRSTETAFAVPVPEEAGKSGPVLVLTLDRDESLPLQARYGQEPLAEGRRWIALPPGAVVAALWEAE